MAKKLNISKNEIRWMGTKHQWVVGKYQVALWWNLLSGKHDYRPLFSFHPRPYPKSDFDVNL